MDKRLLVHYQTFKFSTDFWNMAPIQRRQELKDFIDRLRSVADQVEAYQVFPTRHEWDLLVWSTVDAEKNDTADVYFRKYAKELNQMRECIVPGYNLWGFTKPSQYSKAKRSTQEIDPFDAKSRTSYFVIYPFTKTPEWYMKTRAERQEMMSQHIQLGKQYKEITQLLLYSFGLQDQEFVVAYECEDLAQFSDLVYDLRMTAARPYTLNDMPIITGIHRTADELLDLFN